MSNAAVRYIPPPIPARPGTPASVTLDHCEHIIECGAFAGPFEKNIELPWGRIVEMVPIGPGHSNDVGFLTSWSVQVTQTEEIRVRIQNPICQPQGPDNAAKQILRGNDKVAPLVLPAVSIPADELLGESAN